jgi:hypothetical protein
MVLMIGFRAMSGVVLLAASMFGSWWAVSVRADSSGAPHAKQFTLFMYETPEEFAVRMDASGKGAEYWKAWGAYRDQMQQAGVLRGGMPLPLAGEAKQVRLRDGTVKVTDGMFGASDPQMTGYFMIEVSDLDAAQAWAAKAPNAGSSLVVVVPAFPVTMPN